MSDNQIVAKTSEELTEARSKLAKAQRLLRQRRFQEAKHLLEQVCELEPDLSPKETVESAAKLLGRIDREQRLKLSRRILVGTVLATSVVIAILTILPLKSTPVELTLHVGRAGFESRASINFEAIRLAGFNLVGMTELKFKLADENDPAAADESFDMPRLQRVPNAQGSSMVRTTDSFARVTLKSSYLRLADLSAPARTRVVLETPEFSRETVKIILSEKQIAGMLDTSTEVTIACQDCEYKEGEKAWQHGDQASRKFTSDTKTVHFAGPSNAGNIQLDLRPDAGKMQSGPLLVGRNLKINSLELIRPRPPKPPLSSIVEPGRVRFIDFSDRQFSVAPGDFLILQGLSDFQIRSVTFGNHFTIEAAGQIKKMVRISGNLRRDLMPSILEWLLANYTLKLFMAGLLPVLSVVLAAIYRLKILDEG